MHKKETVIFAGLGIMFLISASGCVSVVKKQSDLDVQGLKNQVAALHQQIQYKDEEINSLKSSANTASVGNEAVYPGGIEKKSISEVKSRPNARQIQTCLKNAGYNPGAVDGKMGKQTRTAIRAFQKDHDLKVDGKVGKRTWKLLSEYLKEK